MKDIINPHDKLFKEIEKVKKNSIDLIKSTFPKELLAKLNLETLENDNNSYIDENLQEYYSDLVYNCRYNGNTTIKISILFEHKSYKPKNEYFQLLRYIINIWDYSVNNKEEPQIVIPVIFYHGEDKWEVKPLFNYFKGADNTLKQFIPDFKYIITDLNKIPDEVIIKEKFNNINKVMALLFKHISDDKYIKEQFVDIFSLIEEYFTEDKKELIIIFLLYVMNTTEIDKEYIGKCLDKISMEGGRIAMTTAMKLREEGIREGKIEDAKRMLSDGVSVEKTTQYTGLPLEDVKNIDIELN